MVFWANVVWAFALVALLLFAMAYLARTVQRGRIVVGLGRRLVTTVESTPLAQNVAVHVIKIADRYFLVGGGAAGVALIAEIPGSDVEPFIAEQKRALDQQRETFLRPFRRIVGR